MSFFQRVPGIFISPKKVFADVDAGAPWWEPWVWGSVLYVCVAYLSLPIQLRLYELGRDKIPPEDYEKGLAYAQSALAKVLAVGTWPVLFLLEGVLLAAVSYLAVSALSERSSFRKHLAVCLWADTVAALGALLSTLVVRQGGMERIRGARDAFAAFGPAALVSKESGVVWFAFLSSLDIFYLGLYALVGVGVVQVFGLSRKASLLAVIPIWIVVFVISLFRLK